MTNNEIVQKLEKGITNFECFDGFPNYIESLGLFLKNVEPLGDPDLSIAFLVELKSPVPEDLLSKYKITKAEKDFPQHVGKYLIGYTNALRSAQNK